MKIGIIGSGSYGTALAKTFSENKGNSILIYSIDPQAIENIRKYSENLKYLPNIKLPKSIKITDNLADLQECEILVFAVPSSAYEIVAKNISPYYVGQIIVSVSKGIGKNGEVLTDIIESKLKCNNRKVLSLSGPSIALELAKGKPTQVILGGDRNFTQIVKKAFETKTFFIRCTRDKKGIQLLGFYKNILAILVGLCDGLDLGNNFKSALVTKAYSEFYYLNENVNIRRHSFIDYAGLGDLYVTSTSEDSRNRKFGKAIAKTSSLKKVKEEIGQVIEGYENLLRLEELYTSQNCCNWFETNLVKTLLEIIKSSSQNTKKKLLLKYLHSSEIKAIVFDWGNVLTKDYYSFHVAKMLAKKYKLDENKLLSILESSEHDSLIGEDTINDFYRKIKSIYSEIKFADFKEAYEKSITWNTDLLSYCEKLSVNYNLYILSNNYSWVVNKIKPKLKKIFKGMIFSNEVKLIKPNNEIFEALLEKYNLRPENCIYVDDSHSNILAGERNKFNVVEFKSIDDLKKTLSEKIIGFK